MIVASCWRLIAFNVLLAPNLSAAAHRVIFNRIGPTRLSLYLANADGSNERLLLPAEGLDYNGSFSPDGRWIIFTSERAGSADIYRVHLDGTGLQRLTDDPAFDDQAALSPDGSKLAFVSTRNGGMARVWVMDLATRRCRILTHRSGGEFRPSWSPDGNWIAFTSDEGTHPGRIARSAELLQSGGFEFLQSTDLYMIRSDGTGLRRLTQPGGFAGSPKWSPDGKRIAFYQTTIQASFSSRSRRGPRENIDGQIVSLDVKTAERKEHTSGSGLKVSPQWLGKDRIGYVRKQGDDPGLEFTSGEKGARGEFRNPSWSPDERHVVFYRELPAERPWMTPTFSADPDFELMLTDPFPAYAPKGDQVVVSARPEGEPRGVGIRPEAEPRQWCSRGEARPKSSFSAIPPVMRPSWKNGRGT